MLGDVSALRKTTAAAAPWTENAHSMMRRRWAVGRLRRRLNTGRRSRGLDPNAYRRAPPTRPKRIVYPAGIQRWWSLGGGHCGIVTWLLGNRPWYTDRLAMVGAIRGRRTRRRTYVRRRANNASCGTSCEHGRLDFFFNLYIRIYISYTYTLYRTTFPNLTHYT